MKTISEKNERIKAIPLLDKALVSHFPEFLLMEVYYKQLLSVFSLICGSKVMFSFTFFGCISKGVVFLYQ